MKFIHAADVHLDSPLRGLQSYEGVSIERIRSATRQAFLNLVDFALQQQVDLFLLAGDLYDGDWKDHQTGLFLTKQLVRLRDAGIRSFLISGNHDAANRMTRSLQMPLNHDGSQPLLPHDQATTTVVDSLGTAVHGRGFSQPAEMRNLVDEYPAPISGLFNIGLLHTSLTGAEGHEPYAPCSIEQLTMKGYQYWALGHVHQRAQYPVNRQPGDPWIMFSGNLQGRHIRETGAKGCFLVETENQHVRDVTFHAMDVVRWTCIELPLEIDDGSEELEARLRKELVQTLAGAEGRMLAARVTLSGKTRLHQRLSSRREQWTNQIRSWALEIAGEQIWIEKVRLKTTDPAGDVAQPASEAMGPLEEIAGYIAELKGDPRSMATLRDHFSSLRRKLPESVLDSPELACLTDPAAMSDMLDEVEPLLLGQLKEETE